MRTAGQLLREAALSARSQPVASLLTMAVIAGMCVATLLTTGRTVAAEDAVLAEIDEAGTRSVVVRAEQSAGVTAGILDHLNAVDGIDSAIGLGPVVDAHNSQLPNGAPVGLRAAYGELNDAALEGSEPARFALASHEATQRLGLSDGYGGVTTTTGHTYTVNQILDTPQHLEFLEPLVLIPSTSHGSPSGNDRDDPLTVLVVLAESPQDVSVVAEVVAGLLDGVEPTKLSIETSAQLADIRSAISGELGSYGRTTVLGILAISAIVVAANLLGLVVMRRKDFGRRRALGATQGLIVTMLLAQVGILCIVGAGLGTAGTLAWLAANAQPLPDTTFSLAVGVSATLTALVAALLPAVVAARRDPLHELRVP